MDESAHFAGLDIGGTTVKAALLNGTGRQIGEGVGGPFIRWNAE